MTYAKLYPSLVLKNLLQPRNPPQIPEPLPWWYKHELRRAFHQGAPEHDIENCYPLKYEVQKLIKNGCPREFKVFDVRFIQRSLVAMHKDICMVSDCEHDYDSCAICSVNPRGCKVVKRDIQRVDSKCWQQFW
ncbi:hypothetical protein KIW84_075907 [Lathyrus oleraceus]|uniref:Uncharacterized protein n=1 Tax=Pisum sativum TaxID=3888 RepID=A0A9D4VY22_PEA|nr:hypothetical protein KIW84_075907 [Pisum sativum]